MDENKYLLGFENGIYDFRSQNLEQEYLKIMYLLNKTNYVPLMKIIKNM